MSQAKSQAPVLSDALTRVPVIVPAAGIGSRMAADRPKQYLTIDGRYLIDLTLSRLRAFLPRAPLYVGLHPHDGWWESTESARMTGVEVFSGGDSRADTVRHGLERLQQVGLSGPVLVHDAARPCITGDDIALLLRQAGHRNEGGLLVAPIPDTVKQIGALAGVTMTLDREHLRRALTPQLFPLELLLDALVSARRQGTVVTDESSAVEALGHSPLAIEGRTDNIKVTHRQDLALAAWYLEQQQSEQGNHTSC